MVANAREAAALRQVEIQKEKEAQEKKKAEEEAKKAEEAAKAERDKSMSLQPGVAVGTMDPQDDEKVVYLTLDVYKRQLTLCFTQETDSCAILLLIAQHWKLCWKQGKNQVRRSLKSMHRQQLRSLILRLQ